MSAVRGYMWSQAGEEGLILCGREYMNSLQESSFSEVKAAIREHEWLSDHYEIGEKFIRTRDRRIEYAFAGLRHNLDSIKSKARIRLGWVDEAESVTEEAWQKLIPTLREVDSELWLTWNPEHKASATNKRFFNSTDPRTKIVELNWRDNPWFPEILDRVRLKDKGERPDDYEHIWEGAYRSTMSGAYFARDLSQAKEEGRIGFVAADPLMTLRAYWDIGGTGAKADACAIWIAQFVGKEVRVLDYYEAVGQPLSVHVAWLRDNGYGKAQMILPHDGAQHDKVYQVSYQSSLQTAEFDVRVIASMGAGAANRRIEAARRMFPSVWFHADKTEPGRDALGWYHEKRDELRRVGLGPSHDWASHGADAYGLMAVDHADHHPLGFGGKLVYPNLGIA
jgi:phage terminase large subunit